MNRNDYATKVDELESDKRNLQVMVGRLQEELGRMKKQIGEMRMADVPDDHTHAGS